MAESSHHYGERCAVVVVDVIRSITVAAAAVESGRRCFFAPSVEAALLLAKRLGCPLLVGEMGGSMPYGFDINNSPVEIESIRDVSRPAILVSSSGIPLLYSLRNCNSVYVACIRNYGATVNHLVGLYSRVEVLGAPTRGEFREEDQLCCAWIAAGFMKAGYTPKNKKTAEIVNRWKDKPVTVCAEGKSAEYLRKTGQTRDLDYIIKHVNDFYSPLTVENDEIVKIPDLVMKRK
ncbi:MAG: 2-phosphosulfolactate phosphatase [Candidatus Bathyarchaeia archaeon]